MTDVTKPKYYLAIDIGASSGRLILGTVENRTISLSEAHRFSNGAVQKNGHLCWDVDSLFENILEGLKKCKARGCVPETIGIDTWGVDFALLGPEGERVADVVAYRDKRTEKMDGVIEKIIPFQELYARTGIQKQPFNTIYQLAALKKDAPAVLDKADRFLMIPDYLNYLLTGVKKQEYTNATTTALVNAETGQWDEELISRLELPHRLFGPLSMPGTSVGRFKKEIIDQVGFDAEVLLPATHDTGSAFLAVPAPDEYSIYISSGTWSLLGVELPNPILTDRSRQANFTNEGGYNRRFRYLKNIMGLWMIQNVRKEYSEEYSFPELAQLARGANDFNSVVDVNDPAFLAPESMIDEVKKKCAKSGQTGPQTAGEVLRVVYRSLARCYAEAVSELSEITGRQYRRINIVGGGCRDEFLNQLTADATGLPVFAGPTEGTALGNLMVQTLKAGAFKDLAEAREAVARSFEVTVYHPKEDKE